MAPNSMPSCLFHPSLAALVDDNGCFLEKLTLAFDSRLSYVTFTQPEKALEFIKKNHNTEQSVDVLMDVEAESYGSAEHQMKLNFSKLYKKIYDPERFNETTTVVVDYAMPKINGYEFCQRLHSTAIKKVMLTGEADDNLAIDLFNQGLLNHYIHKLKSVEMNDLILNLQKDYFSEKSKSLLDVLKKQAQFHMADEVVSQKFQEMCTTYNIVEYYMINSNGSFLLLSFDGTPYWFLVIDEDELCDFYEVADDQKAALVILKALQAGSKIPYFSHYTEMMDARGYAWEPYLHSAEKIIGKKTYYYALVKEGDVLEIDRSRILSFKKYLENVWPPQ